MTLDSSSIRDAQLVAEVKRVDGQGTISLFITSTPNAPASGPGFGYKTVKSKAQVYFYYDPQRFPDGRDNPHVASALQRLGDEMPRHPEKFCNCEPISNRVDSVGFPEFADYAKRLESFSSWPRSDIKPEKLAQVSVSQLAQVSVSLAHCPSPPRSAATFARFQ